MNIIDEEQLNSDVDIDHYLWGYLKSLLERVRST